MSFRLISALALTIVLLGGTATASPADREVLYTIDIGTALETGGAKLTVMYPSPFMEPLDGDTVGVIRLRGSNGRVVDVPAGHKTTVEIAPTFPRAVPLTSGSAPPVYFVFRQDGDAARLQEDRCLGWGIVSIRREQANDGQDTLCRPDGATCPAGYEKSNDRPRPHEPRCRTNKGGTKKAATLCYRPGSIRFKAAKGTKVVATRQKSRDGERRPIVELELGAGQLSEPIAVPYEACPPVSFRVGGHEYFFAVGRREEWLVEIDGDGRLAVTAKDAPPTPTKGTDGKEKAKVPTKSPSTTPQPHPTDAGK
jgi:hypothetical protein